MTEYKRQDIKTTLALPKLWQSRSVASYILPSEEEGLVRGGAPFGKGDGGIRRILIDFIKVANHKIIIKKLP